jgi:hypothetical protein
MAGILVTSDQESLVLKGYAKDATLNELEVRFGRHNRAHRFEPGVPASTFQAMLKCLVNTPAYTSTPALDMLKLIAEDGTTLTITEPAAIRAVGRGVIMPSTGTTCMRKVKEVPFENDEYGYRIGIATETSLPVDAFPSLDTPCTYRLLKRFSFTSVDTLCRLDLSITQQSRYPAKSLSDARLQQTEPRYEIEIEWVGEDRSLVHTAIYAQVYLALKYIQDTHYPMTRSQGLDVLKDYADAFFRGNTSSREEIAANPRRFFLGAMPGTLSLVNVLPLDIKTNAPNIRATYPDDYTVTEKADGVRCLLFVAASGDAYLIDRSMRVRRTGLQQPTRLTLIDGEYVPELLSFLAFDLLFQDGKDVRDLPLMRSKRHPEDRRPGRTDLLRSILLQSPFSIASEPGMSVKAKRFLADIDCLAEARNMWKGRTTRFKHNIDGIFFTPRRDRYPKTELRQSWGKCLKWKPRDLLSIDFKCSVKPDVQYVFRTNPGEERVMIPCKVVHLLVAAPGPGDTGPSVQLFNPPTHTDVRQVKPYLAKIPVDDNKMFAVDPLTHHRHQFGDRSIVEFAYDSSRQEGLEWVPLRVRVDKVVPNAARTADSVWEVMHDAKGLLSDPRFFEIVGDEFSERLLREEWAQHQKGDAYYHVQESLSERHKSPIYNMRTFHNIFVKRALYMAASMAIIERTKEPSVKALLELGAGKGGDYSKWRDAEVTRVYAVDTDKRGLMLIKENHAKMLSRNKNPRAVDCYTADMAMQLSSAVAAANAEDRKSLQDFYKSKGLHYFPLVSCQFAAHYCFNTELRMRTFMMNIYENLEPGGYFIGTLLDGASVFSVLESAGQPSVEFSIQGKPFARLTKRYAEDNLLAWGQAIEVWVTSISDTAYTEYLVNFEAFATTMAEDYDVAVLSKEEAVQLGLPDGSGLFGDMYDAQDSKHTVVLSDAEKAYSFLNRYFVMKRVGTGNAKVINKWLKAIRRPVHVEV